MSTVLMEKVFNFSIFFVHHWAHRTNQVALFVQGDKNVIFQVPKFPQITGFFKAGAINCKLFVNSCFLFLKLLFKQKNALA